MLIKGNDTLIENLRNILLIQLGDIGDVVLTLPSIRALRENFPRANVIVVVRKKARELVENCPWATHVISIDKQKRPWVQEITFQLDFFSRLREFHFDLAIDMRTGTRGAILALLSGARQRIGFYAANGDLWRNRVFTHLALPEHKPGEHMAETLLNLLGTYRVKTDHIWPELPVPLEKQEEAKDLFREASIPEDRPVIAVQPFSLWRYKEWGTEKYVGLVNRILSDYGFPVIITGSVQERCRAHEIVEQCGSQVYNLAGKTSLGLLAAVLKACSLLISVDSGGMHIAGAVGTPTLTIVGPSSSVTWAPRGRQHRVVYKNLPCLPCHQKGCQGSGTSRCLEELTIDEVFSVVEDQIVRVFNGGVTHSRALPWITPKGDFSRKTLG